MSHIGSREKGKKVLRDVMKIVNTITYILMDDLRIRDVLNQLTEVKLLMVASVP